jgi:acid phosphatase family membrane protein YuiD
MISTVFISESIKLYIIGKGNPRPKGAEDCNLFCNDGDQSGKPGMPSSHSALVSFFSGFYLQQTSDDYLRIILVVYALLVMLSRYLKRCHTINQIIVGGLLGYSLSWIVVRHL